MRGATAVLVGAVALASGAHAQDGIRPYPGSRDLALGSEAIAYFTTADPPDAVVAFYVRLWEGEGLPVTVEGRPGDLQVVAAFFTREARHHLVVVQRAGGVTLGFRAERELPRAPLPEGPPDTPPVAPRERAPPAVVLLPGTLEAVWRERLDALGREGFVRVRGETPRFVELRSSAEVLTLAMAPVAPGLVAVLEAREPAPGAAP